MTITEIKPTRKKLNIKGRGKEFPVTEIDLSEWAFSDKNKEDDFIKSVISDQHLKAR